LHAVSSRLRVVPSFLQSFASQQLAGHRTLRNISRANAREPGALPSVVVTLIRIACIAVDNTLYTMSLALEIVLEGLPCINTLNTFSTV
jgi:hypothetical protein